MQQSTSLPVTDEDKLAQLYQRHVYVLLNYILRHTRTHEDAEDILLEVFLAAQDRGALVALSEGEQLAWLRRVAYNKCVDLIRNQSRYPSVGLDSADVTLYAPEDQRPDIVAVRSEEYSLLHQHVLHLSTQQQEILHLKFGQSLSSAEIARRLNKKEGSIRMLLSRALNRLRTIYSVEKGERPHEE
jgi:RNA polymerase sigma-70 factor (ECF subfamily)